MTLVKRLKDMEPRLFSSSSPEGYVKRCINNLCEFFITKKKIDILTSLCRKINR